MSVARPRPESECRRCDGPNIVWFAPSPLWNAVMRGQAEPYELHDGIVCPTCFGVLANEAGLGGIFELDVAGIWKRRLALLDHIRIAMNDRSLTSTTARARIRDLFREYDNARGGTS